jgi:hypothetical protein
VKNKYKDKIKFWLFIVLIILKAILKKEKKSLNSIKFEKKLPQKIFFPS